MKIQREDAAVTVVTKPTTLAPPKRHTAVTLLALVGAVEPSSVSGYVRGFSQGDLIERGARIATARVVEEGAPIAGAAAEFVSRATPAQRRLLATVTPTFLSSLATGLHTAAELDSALARRKARSATRRKAAKAAAAAALPDIRARRQLFCTHLLSMTGGDAAWASRIEGVCGAAPDAASLASSLDAMVTEGRTLAAHAKTQKAEVTVDAAYFDEMTALADKAREAHAETRGDAEDGEAQARLDWWDGANLWFLGALVDNFEQARKVDRTIPKLSLGKLLKALKPGRSASRRKSSAAPAKPVTPAKPTPVDPPA